MELLLSPGQERNSELQTHLQHGRVLCHSLTSAPSPVEMEFSPSQIHVGAAVSQRSLLDMLLQRNKNWNPVYLLQMTNESIKLSREITLGDKKKQYPPRNQIIFDTVTGSDKPQPVKLQKLIVHWRTAKSGPVAALLSLSCILSPWPLKRALCSPWVCWSETNFKEEAAWACLSWTVLC